MSKAISALETLTLAPILIGESIASTTLVAAQSYLAVLQAVFPGSDEASFSLTSFVTLVRRELNEDMQDADAPVKRYGLGETMKSLVAWATLQGLTSAWQEQKWFRYLKEIPVNDDLANESPKVSTVSQPSRVHVKTDVVYPSHSGHIITADIGDAPIPPALASFVAETSDPESIPALKSRLRRYSQLVLAGYGGASLLFFGVPPVPVNSPLSSGSDKLEEERKLATAVGSAEIEASGSRVRLNEVEEGELSSKPGGSSYSWWDVLRGKHDQDILLHYAKSHHPPEEAFASVSNYLHLSYTATETRQSSPVSPPAVSSMIGGDTSLMPRFWVLTDHARKEIVLVLRGTMSLNELAVDLTCDPTDFTIYSPSNSRKKHANEQEELDMFDEELDTIPGSFPIDLSTPPPSPRNKRWGDSTKTSGRPSETRQTFEVHGGMLKMARAMGGKAKPVHAAVKYALKQNETYSESEK